MSARKDITIPAGGHAQIEQRGSYFYCISTTGAYDVQPDYGDKHTISGAGGKFGSDSQKFKRLTFYNDTAEDIDTTVFIGSSSYSASDASVVGVQSAGAGRSKTQQFLINGNAGDIKQLSAVDLWYTRATVYGFKDLKGTANAGNVNIGNSGGANEQPFAIAPADQVVLDAPAGQQRNFADWYAAFASNGDGLVVIWS